MKDTVWKNISQFIGLLPIGALFGLAAFIATIEIKDLDLWLHLAMGKYIVLHKSVPQIDVLSCSIAGKPWVNHEWLFQVIIYLVHKTWGPEGLSKMQVGIVILTMLFLLFLGYNKDKQLAVSFGLLMVFAIYQQRFTIRPDLYSLLFFTIFIYVLALHIDKRWSLTALFLTQVLWTNMHGFFFFGPVFVMIGLVSEWIKRSLPLPYEWNQVGRLTDEEYKRLKKILLATILACLINPSTIYGAWYPVKVLFSLGGENKIFFQYIQELQKPIIPSTVFQIDDFLQYRLIIFISFITFIFNRRKIDVSALLFWLIFLFFSLVAIRNMSFFAFAAYLVYITNILNFTYKDIVPIRFTQEKFQYLTAIVAKLLLLIWMINYTQAITRTGYYDFEKYEMKSEFGGVALRSYPHQAVKFLVDNKVKGNFFNDFNSGAYLLGQSFPDIKVFIDGRTEVYGAEFFKDYQKMWGEGDSQLLDQTIEKLDITGALLNSVRQHIPYKVLNYFYQKKDWKVVYFDHDAVIFLKDVSQHKEVIEKFTIDLTQWEPKKIELSKLGPVAILPYQNFYRAYTLESLGLDEPALAEALEAVNVNPSYPDPYTLIGKVYAKRKEFDKAFDYYRLASSFAPYNKEMRLNLALTLYDLTKYKEAAKEYERMVHLWPKDAKISFLLSRAYAKDEQFDKAKETLLQAHKLDNKDAVDVLEIGQVFFDSQKYKEAEDIYKVALATGNNLDSVHLKLGLTYQALGDRLKAKEAFEKGLSLNAANEELKKNLEVLIQQEVQ